MKLTKLKIRNFRCFGEEQIIEIDDLTTLIGNNSTGKTTILNALLKIFSDNGADRNLIRSDFHLPKDISPYQIEKQDLHIEAIFSFAELEETEEGELNYSIPVFFDHFVVNNVGEIPYLRIRLEASWKKSNNIEGSIESNIFYITCPESDEITENDKKQTNRHDLNNIRMIYIPAVRDPAKQLKNVSGTLLYRILNGINWTEGTKTEIVDKIQELNNTFDKEEGIAIFKRSLESQWKKYDSDFRYNTASMRFNSADMDSILKKSEVVFSPTVTGREYGIDEIGDGLKSLFYISLVDTILEIENKIREEIQSNKESKSFVIEPPILTLIAVEEPENHIAPHLVGKLVKIFNDIAKKTNAQTIIASHSTAIVKRIDPQDIRYLKLDTGTLTSKVLKIHFPDYEKYEDKYKYIKEAVQAYPEIYFAKLVILGEGDSEEIVLPRLIENMGGEIDSSGISIVPLGGRFVNHLWRLLNDLEIPFITLLDLDRERYGAGWCRIKYVCDQLIKIGYDRNEILATEKGVLTQEEFNKMQEWPVEKIESMNEWIDFLEEYDVFFSAPLDLDFMMLECFEDNYKSIIEGNEGPFIPNKGKILKIEEEDKDLLEYKDRIKDDVHNTLKKNGGDGTTYSEKQKELMIWYNYFFLNRGKPTTHFYAMSKIEKEVLIENSPEVLKRIVKRVNDKLGEQGTGVGEEHNE